MVKRHWPSDFVFVGDTINSLADKHDFTLIVLDPDCYHCRNLFQAMVEQGVTKHKIALLMRWKDDDDLLVKLGGLARPTAFPHAIDLSSNNSLSIDQLCSVLDITI